jgi:hypothetical protein
MLEVLGIFRVISGRHVKHVHKENKFVNYDSYSKICLGFVFVFSFLTFKLFYIGTSCYLTDSFQNNLENVTLS